MYVKLSRSLVGAAALVGAVALASCDSGGSSHAAGRDAPSPAPGSTQTSVTPVAPSSSAGSAAAANPQPVIAKSTAPQPNTVTMGNARLTLPAGWTSGLEHAKGLSSNIAPTWCLSPTPLPSPVYVGQQCAAEFMTMPSDVQMSVDTQGGIVSNPEYCRGYPYSAGQLLEYRDTMLGNRPADYRRWLFVCKDGTRWPIEQYVADNVQSFVLFSDQADSTIHAALTFIAQSAVLPAISGPLRRSDFGFARSVTPLTGGGYRVTIDRVVQGTDGVINNNPATYPYDIPAAAVHEAREAPQVGGLINIFTDGYSVTGYQLLPPERSSAAATF